MQEDSEGTRGDSKVLELKGTSLRSSLEAETDTEARRGSGLIGGI